MASRSKQPLKSFRGTLVLAGAGKMGGAMLEGWLARGLAPKQVVVIDPKPSAGVKKLSRRGVRINPKGKLNAAVVVIAVKPQMADNVLPSLKAYAGKSTVAVSVMAGRTLSYLSRAFGNDVAIVRAMPNTPAAIGRGMTVAVANAKTKTAQRKLAGDILAASGAVEWVADEKLMDAVTAVSGSGPAYVFLLAEALAQAGVDAGLSPKLAATLARETVAGSGELLYRSSDDAATLRQNVTSPNGTTAAALAVLMASDGFPALLKKAVAAAAKRSRELAG